MVCRCPLSLCGVTGRGGVAGGVNAVCSPRVPRPARVWLACARNVAGYLGEGVVSSS